MPLSDALVRNAKPRERRYKLFDETGLFLIVTPQGGKWWRVRYRWEGREQTLSLGTYPAVTLKRARMGRDAIRQQILEGINPAEARKAEDPDALRETFESQARQWHEARAPRWSAVHAARVLRDLERDVFPWIGAVPIATLAAPQLKPVLARIRDRGAIESAHRVLQIIGQVCRYAIAGGHAERNPATDLKGWLPSPTRTHFAALTDPRAIGELLRALDGYQGTFPVQGALRLAPRLMVRPGELRQAEWAEFDLEAALWRNLGGREVCQKIRYEPKDFRQRWPDGQGGWLWKRPKDAPHLLYRLPELRAAIAEGRTVFVVEGEKDAARLASAGLVATANIEGAARPDQRAKWRSEYTEQLSGAARVILLPDNDEPGRAHMNHVAAQLAGKVGDVRILELPGLSEKGDVSDWLDAGHTVDELERLASEAPEPPPPPSSRAGTKNKDPSLHSHHAQSISYSFTLDNLSFTSFTAEVPHLHDYDEKGRPTLIESKVANQFAILMKWRFAFCRESLRWYAFAGTHWHAINGTVLDELVTRMLYAGAPEGFKARTVTAVLSLLTKGLLPLPENRDARALPFQNGLLNLDTRELVPITPDNAPIWCLPYAHDPAADCLTFKTWLLQAVAGDTETVEFLRAWLAALLTGRADLQKFLHLLGPGGTGKGVFTRLAELLVGKHNATITDLRNLEQNRFETASLYGKRLVCITDTSKYGGSIDVLKAMTGQDSLRLERKHQQQGATFRFGGLVLLASNEALQTTDYTSALERRRLTVEFKRLVSDAERADWNARGGEEAILHREIAGVANWVLGLSREDVTRRLTRQPRRVAQSNREALRNNNPVADWLIENTIPEPGARVRIGDHRPINEHGRTWFEHANERLYPNYLTWCHRAKREPLALRRFSSLAVDMARSLGVDVLKTREGSGVHLQGLRLRSESETPHDWLEMNEETAETVKDGEGLVKEVKDGNKKSACNQLIMNEMMDVKDFPNIYSHMDAGTSFFAEPPGKVAATCQPSANYPFRYVTKCDRPTPIQNPAGWGDPIGCSNCGARWGDGSSLAEPSSVAAELERGGIS